MKTLYLQCGMGAAGDMLTGAVFELLEDEQAFLDAFNGQHLPGVRVDAVRDSKQGIAGTHWRVTVDGEQEDAHGHGAHRRHEHVSYQDVCERIRSLALPPAVKDNALAVYRIIGEAESRAHGCPIDQIHFHEVGTLDALADVVGFSLAVHLLSPDVILASPVRVGSGTVRCAHGVLPVPAPATADILKGVPFFSGEVEGEMCTPTGAALLKHFAASFLPMPLMTTHRVGYGLGTRDFGGMANCVRAFLGESLSETGCDGSVVELCCNLDDMTPEAVGYAADLLLQSGALDVFSTSIQMKKSRPGTLLCVICTPEKEEALSRLMLTHTATLGVRRRYCARRSLQSHFIPVATAFGNIRIKVSTGWGADKFKPEYEDVAAAAEVYHTSFDKVWRAAVAAYENGAQPV